MQKSSRFIGVQASWGHAVPDPGTGEAKLRSYCEAESSVFGDWLIRHGGWWVETGRIKSE